MTDGVPEMRLFQIEVSSTKQIWRIWGEGYVNVYPDAGFRSGKDSARIYP